MIVIHLHPPNTFYTFLQRYVGSSGQIYLYLLGISGTHSSSEHSTSPVTTIAHQTKLAAFILSHNDILNFAFISLVPFGIWHYRRRLAF